MSSHNRKLLSAALAVLVASSVACVIVPLTGVIIGYDSTWLPSDIPNAVGLTLGGLGAIWGPALLVVSTLRRRRQGSTTEQIQSAHAKLASWVRAEWTEELAVRGIDRRAPALRLRWRLRSRRESTTYHEYKADMDGLEQLADRFLGSSDRLWIVSGGGGMGKTTLAAQLTATLADRAFRAQDTTSTPVPVFLSLASWDVERFPVLGTWIVQMLTQVYPGLLKGAYGSDPINGMLIEDRLVAVLDGLDEVPKSRRSTVIRQIEAFLIHGDRRVVITTRPDGLAEARARPGQHAFARNATYLIPVLPTGDEVRTYVTTFLGGEPVPPSSWTIFLQRLEDQDDPVYRSVRTPVALWLLRTSYLDTGSEPIELLEALDRHDETAAAEEIALRHLLDRLVPSLLDARGVPRQRQRAPDLPNHPEVPAFLLHRRWEPSAMTRWLGYLAGYLRSEGLTNYEWRRLRDAPPMWSVSTVFGILCALVFGAAAGVGATVIGGAGLGAGTALVVAVLGSLGGLLAAGFREGPEPNYEDLAGHRKLPSVMRGLGRLILVVLAFGTLGGLLYGAGTDTRSALLGTVSFGLVGGLAGAVAIVTVAWPHRPYPLDRANNARQDLRSHFYEFVRKVVVGAAFGAVGGVVADILLRYLFGLSSGVYVYAAAAGAVGGSLVGAVVGNPWIGYLVAHTWLACLRKLPWHLADMVEDAHRLGLLRQVGVAYEFRHERLLHHFASPGYYP